MFRGTIRVPGDKSITHRALILAALAEGTSEVFGPLRSDDCRSTVNCLRRLGVQIAEFPDKTVVEGLGMTGLVSPEAPLDCGNSGTTMRLLAGVLAAQPFVSVLTGDDSLNTRPMGRIVEPLKQMGALIKGRQYDQFAPLVIRGGSLQGITYELPTASAQVKSAILLAGLNAEGETRLRGRIDSRDHSERMLAVFGADIDTTDEEIVLRPGHSLKAQTVHIPGDISSAAFFIAAAAAVPGSYLEVEDVGLNPTRTGFVDVLQAMGADIEVLYEHDLAGEPVGRIVVRGRELEGTVIDGKLIPRVIDELPILAVTASLARGTTLIRDAAELRVKETDRIKALAEELSKAGVTVEELPDGLSITGPARFHAAHLDSRCDHRIAMSLLVLAAVADAPITVENTDCVSISYPDFDETLRSLLGEVR